MNAPTTPQLKDMTIDQVTGLFRSCGATDAELAQMERVKGRTLEIMVGNYPKAKDLASELKLPEHMIDRFFLWRRNGDFGGAAQQPPAVPNQPGGSGIGGYGGPQQHPVGPFTFTGTARVGHLQLALGFTIRDGNGPNSRPAMIEATFRTNVFSGAFDSALGREKFAREIAQLPLVFRFEDNNLSCFHNGVGTVALKPKSPMFDAKPNVIICGNAGKGKSWLCNGLFKALGVPKRFTSGLSVNRQTTAMQMADTPYCRVIDVPGLLDADGDASLQQNKQELKRGLSMEGAYLILFLVTLEGGRIRYEDLAMLRAVCGSFDARPEQVGIVINKVDEKHKGELTYVMQRGSVYRDLFANACGIGSLVEDAMVALTVEEGNGEIGPENLDLVNGLLQSLVPRKVEGLRDAVLTSDLLKQAKADEEVANKALELEKARGKAALNEQLQKNRSIENQIRARGRGGGGGGGGCIIL